MAEDLPEIDSNQQKLKARPSRARYDKAHLALERKWRRRRLETDRMMREVVDVLWDAFADSPYRWCGFSLLAADGQSLLPGPCRDKAPAGPIPLEGARGRAVSEGRNVILSDAGRSEIALPVFNGQGKLWAVFSADSATPGVFDEMDQRWLEKILKHFQDVP